MAKEVAVGKRAKISQAQQYVLLAVLGASLFLGAAIATVFYLNHKISFNNNVIAAQNKSIVAYSSAISGIGICKKPNNSKTYNNDELKRCNPETIDVSSIPGTLRANILEKMAANSALNSTPNENAKGCVNPATNKNYTYEEMRAIYNNANGEQRAAASELIQVCSALRIIPDALPALRNEEALLASLTKIFSDSGKSPDSLSPTGSPSASSLGSNLMTFSFRLRVESDAVTTKNILSSIERSIRDFDIGSATIGIGDPGSLTLEAQASAYYMNPTTITETTQTIKSEGNKK